MHIFIPLIHLSIAAELQTIAHNTKHRICNDITAIDNVGREMKELPLVAGVDLKGVDGDRLFFSLVQCVVSLDCTFFVPEEERKRSKEQDQSDADSGTRAAKPVSKRIVRHLGKLSLAFVVEAADIYCCISSVVGHDLLYLSIDWAIRRRSSTVRGRSFALGEHRRFLDGGLKRQWQ